MSAPIDYGEPFDLPLRYDPKSDWGWIRDANEHTACLARKSLDNREADEYRRIREDPMKRRAERIVSCVNACAGIEDPAEALRAAKEALKLGWEAWRDWNQYWGDDTGKNEMEQIKKAIELLGGDDPSKP